MNMIQYFQKGMIAMASDKKKEFKYHKILALDGCDIFRKIHAANGIAPLTVLKDGKLDTSRFEGVLDESLETEKLATVYKKHAKEIKTYKNRKIMR